VLYVCSGCDSSSCWDVAAVSVCDSDVSEAPSRLVVVKYFWHFRFIRANLMAIGAKCRTCKALSGGERKRWKLDRRRLGNWGGLGGHSDIVGGTASIVQGAKGIQNLVYCSTNFFVRSFLIAIQRKSWQKIFPNADWEFCLVFFFRLVVNHDSYIEYLSPAIECH